MSNDRLRPETIAAHALRAIDEATGAVVPPIYLSSTYARDEDYKPKLKENYVRNGNPTLWQTEEAIAALEQGTSALLFASGMAAITILLETVPQGAHVVAPDVMYYGTRDWMKRLEGLKRITLTLFDPKQPGALEAALQKGKTDLVWIETPLNPSDPVVHRPSRLVNIANIDLYSLQLNPHRFQLSTNFPLPVLDDTEAHLNLLQHFIHQLVGHRCHTVNLSPLPQQQP